MSEDSHRFASIRDFRDGGKKIRDEQDFESNQTERRLLQRENPHEFSPGDVIASSSERIIERIIDRLARARSSEDVTFLMSYTRTGASKYAYV
jgi:hypothetical protein